MHDMTKPKLLTRRQRAVLDELFADEPDDKAILKKYKLDAKLYNKWLTEPAFIEQLDKHSAAAYRRSALHLARSAPKAAVKLVQLSEKGESETTRKACLDIISGCGSPSTADRRRETRDDAPEGGDSLAPELASRLLAALAETADSAEHAVRFGPVRPGVPSASEGPASATG
jgi:hypothetical protein